MRLGDGQDPSEMIHLIRAAEQTGSGLVQSFFMRDQADPQRDEAMALLGRVFAENGMEVVDMSVDHVLADDANATVVLETTVGIGDRRHHGRYVDVYRLRDGTAIEHWHLPFNPRAEAAFFGR